MVSDFDARKPISFARISVAQQIGFLGRHRSSRGNSVDVPPTVANNVTRLFQLSTTPVASPTAQFSVTRPLTGKSEMRSNVEAAA